MQGEKGDRKEAPKSQRREKELPGRKGRRGKRRLWGGHMGDYERGRELLKQRNKLVKMRRKVRLSVHF